MPPGPTRFQEGPAGPARIHHRPPGGPRGPLATPRPPGVLLRLPGEQWLQESHAARVPRVGEPVSATCDPHSRGPALLRADAEGRLPVPMGPDTTARRSTQLLCPLKWRQISRARRRALSARVRHVRRLGHAPPPESFALICDDKAQRDHKEQDAGSDEDVLQLPHDGEELHQCGVVGVQRLIVDVSALFKPNQREDDRLYVLSL
ncbi:hypothetical protein NDU88_003572 [Pleurodeles waltl]|uniref:Uncharacterized protein n=1 Tax=Pleurodeles waltl TaxID=8319 RepID=A0AAV7M3S6_PLEWA|nr:hypothetical protein NDU88_003572 [Pleurodeles waltl]